MFLVPTLSIFKNNLLIDYLNKNEVKVSYNLLSTMLISTSAVGFCLILYPLHVISVRLNADIGGATAKSRAFLSMSDAI